MELPAALTWAGERKNAVLITLRKDGRAQSSDIAYTVEGDAFKISVTADRAKTANMRRDPRIVLHITDPGSWSYLSFDGTAELSPVTTAVDDATSDALVAYYENVAGEPHPDWAEYRRAMVDEGRLIITFRPTKVVGQIH
jgi:PPOX class probable F420-dependent enzyme